MVGKIIEEENYTPELVHLKKLLLTRIYEQTRSYML